MCVSHIYLCVYQANPIQSSHSARIYWFVDLSISVHRFVCFSLPYAYIKSYQFISNHINICPHSVFLYADFHSWEMSGIPCRGSQPQPADWGFQDVDWCVIVAWFLDHLRGHDVWGLQCPGTSWQWIHPTCGDIGA